jgi:hypothetical protein
MFERVRPTTRKKGRWHPHPHTLGRQCHRVPLATIDERGGDNLRQPQRRWQTQQARYVSLLVRRVGSGSIYPLAMLPLSMPQCSLTLRPALGISPPRFPRGDSPTTPRQSPTLQDTWTFLQSNRVHLRISSIISTTRCTGGGMRSRSAFRPTQIGPDLSMQLILDGSWTTSRASGGTRRLCS